jgi:hypothetical protein
MAIPPSARRGRRSRRTAVLVAALAALVLPAGAGASQLVDRGVTAVSLKVDADGIALVSYRTQSGAVRHALVWGAVNAVANVTDGPQQQFEIDYTGGLQSRHDPGYWKTFRNACRPYTGPKLPFFVTGCTAPDGTDWALQSWQRDLPMRGYAPWTAVQKGSELHISHWSGPLPTLEVYRHWTYGRSHQGFFGRLVYDGRPVYGARTPSATVDDPWARNVYVDVFDSDFGSGWRHDTAIATHRRNGGFCFTFVPQPPPHGYPGTKPNGSGLGTRFRISAMGPGVTPIVQWEGPTLGRFDGAVQAQATRVFDRILAGDAHCAPER